MPGVLVPEHGINKDWTHEHCFKGMNCFTEKFFETPQVEASISAWKVSRKNRQILEEWLTYCLDLNVISDRMINGNSCFATKGHRYDQSILTNLVIKYKLKPVKQNINCMHVFKSMSFLNIYMGRTSWHSNVLFEIMLKTIIVTRKIRNFLNKK